MKNRHLKTFEEHNTINESKTSKITKKTLDNMDKLTDMVSNINRLADSIFDDISEFGLEHESTLTRFTTEPDDEIDKLHSDIESYLEE